MSRAPNDAEASNVETLPVALSSPVPHVPPANWRLGFWSLIVTQFQGAFNDNALKFLVIYLIVERNFPSSET